MNHARVHAQDARDLQLVTVRILRAGVQRQRPVGLGDGDARFGFQRHVRLARRSVFMFDDQVGLAQALLHVALGDQRMQTHVALLVHLGSVGLEGLDRVVDNRQNLVVHVDQRGRLLRDALAGSGHERDGVAHVAHLLPADDRLVRVGNAEAVEAGYIRRREHRFDAVELERPARVHPPDEGMGIPAAHKGRVEHPRKGQVRHVPRGPARFALCVDSGCLLEPHLVHRPAPFARHPPPMGAANTSSSPSCSAYSS